MNSIRWLTNLINGPVEDVGHEKTDAELILKGIKETCEISLLFPHKKFSSDEAQAIKNKLRASYANLQVSSSRLNRSGIDPPTKWLTRRFYGSIVKSIKEGETHSILTPLQLAIDHKMK